jgi:hypothetical protein
MVVVVLRVMNLIAADTRSIWMLNKDQAEAAANALLTPGLVEQEAARRVFLERQERKRRSLAKWRRVAIYISLGVMVGGFVGGVVSYSYHDHFLPGAYFGTGFGYIIGMSVGLFIHRLSAKD